MTELEPRLSTMSDAEIDDSITASIRASCDESARTLALVLLARKLGAIAEQLRLGVEAYTHPQQFITIDPQQSVFFPEKGKKGGK